MKGYCDLDQCKVLMEFLPIESADMYYFTIILDYPYSQGKSKTIAKIMDGSFSSNYDTPCWSLSALLSVIKPVNGNSYTLTGTLDGGATIEFDEVTNVMYQREEIIDAVYEMVIWLHKEGVL